MFSRSAFHTIFDTAGVDNAMRFSFGTTKAKLIFSITVCLSWKNDAPVVNALVSVVVIAAVHSVSFKSTTRVTSASTVLDAAHVARFSSIRRRIGVQAAHCVLSAARSFQCTAGASNITGLETQDALSEVVAVSVGVAAPIPHGDVVSAVLENHVEGLVARNALWFVVVRVDIVGEV
jgi:hypothetical protein